MCPQYKRCSCSNKGCFVSCLFTYIRCSHDLNEFISKPNSLRCTRDHFEKNLTQEMLLDTIQVILHPLYTSLNYIIYVFFVNTLFILNTLATSRFFCFSVTNYFLVNLSVADLLVTVVCMPKGAWAAYSRIWYFGEIACRTMNYLQCE